MRLFSSMPPREIQSRRFRNRNYIGIRLPDDAHALRVKPVSSQVAVSSVKARKEIVAKTVEFAVGQLL